MTAHPTVAGPGGWVPAAHELVSVSYPRLVVHGVTGGSLIVVLAVFVPFMEVVVSVAPEGSLEGAAAAVVTSIIVLGSLIIWVGAAVVASILQYGSFVLELVGDELHARYGLLDRRHLVMPLERVQAVEVASPLPRRLLGFETLTFRSAGRGAAVQRLTVPLVRREEVAALLTTVLRQPTSLPDLRPAPPAARRRAVVRHTVPVALAAVVCAALFWPAGIAAALAVVPAWAAGRAAHRGLGHAVTDNVVVARRGWLLRRLAVVPVTRAQSVAVRSTPFQRRSGLATAVVHLAGRGNDPRVVDEVREVAHEVSAHLTGAGRGPADRRR